MEDHVLNKFNTLRLRVFKLKCRKKWMRSLAEFFFFIKRRGIMSNSLRAFSNESQSAYVVNIPCIRWCLLKHPFSLRTLQDRSSSFHCLGIASTLDRTLSFSCGFLSNNSPPPCACVNSIPVTFQSALTIQRGSKAHSMHWQRKGVWCKIWLS